MYTGTENLLNRVIACEYAGKPRMGKVIKATPTTLTIEYRVADEEKPQYRSLTIANIVDMRVEGYTL